MFKFSILLSVLLVMVTNALQAQVFANKEVGQKNMELSDSLKSSEYPYALPILGAKATARGFNLPYSAGLSAQYFTQQSDLIIENLQVGFNNGPLYDLDGIVRFDKAIASASAFTVRPDIWLFPFLNIYGILGKSQASTDVGVGIWIQDENNSDINIAKFNTKIDFTATTFGIGFTPTIGVGGGFIALDMNVAWTDVPQLNKPAQTFVFGPRFGKAFKFKEPDRNIAIWVGGFRVKLNSQTEGSIPLSDILDADGSFQEQITMGQQRVEETQVAVEDWWNGLTDLQQQNPVNIAKYNSANSILQGAGNFLAAAENAAGNIENSSVQYTMDKRVADMWNFITGAQFQLNKHFMIRAEYGFLGSRTQFLTGIQYRFGL